MQIKDELLEGIVLVVAGDEVGGWHFEEDELVFADVIVDVVDGGLDEDGTGLGQFAQAHLEFIRQVELVGSGRSEGADDVCFARDCQ